MWPFATSQSLCACLLTKSFSLAPCSYILILKLLVGFGFRRCRDHLYWMINWWLKITFVEKDFSIFSMNLHNGHKVSQPGSYFFWNSKFRKVLFHFHLQWIVQLWLILRRSSNRRTDSWRCSCLLFIINGMAALW